MNRAGKIIIGLVVFVAIQVLFVGLFFLEIENDLTKEYRKSVEHNFARLAEYVQTNEDNVAAINLSEVYAFNFDNIILAEGDGYVRYLAKESAVFAVGEKFEVSKIDFVEMFDRADYSKETVIDGEDVYLLCKRVGDYALIAYEDMSYQNAYGFEVLLKLMAVALAQGVLLAVIVFLYIKTYTKRQDNLARYNATEARYVVFHIGRNGDVVGGKTNADFVDKYAVQNIVGCVVDTADNIAKALNERLPFNLLFPDKEGTEHYFRCLANKTASGYRILAIDDTVHYFESKRISEQILLDPITELRNKSGLEIDLEQCLKVESKEQRALAIINLKNLENIEALFSSVVKEEVLKNCAKVLKEKYKDFGCGLYYFSGNKMAILCTTTRLTEAVKTSMHEFNSNINAVVRIGQNDVQILTDAVFLYLSNPKEPITLEEIIEYTEYLILNTKTRIDASFISDIFSKSKYYHAIGSKKEITKKIIDENRFHLYYQPQVRLYDDKLISFEALVRLDEISLTTQDFILISEVNGYMLQLGDSIMQKAFEFAQTIKHTGIAISINLSPIQLLNKGFVDNFLNRYSMFELNPSSIALEITETFLMSDVTENIKKIRILHDHGIMVHLDDFGMGYSSLAYLQSFPVDAIKIDKEFVSNIETDDYNRAICDFIISTAKHLKVETIAEGVEKIEQIDTLKKMGCDIVQGYFKGKPMSVNDAIKFIESNKGGKL